MYIEQIIYKDLVSALSTHDKRLAFLFGAGTSAAIKGDCNKSFIPTITELTKGVYSSLLSQDKNNWDNIKEHKGECLTIEDVLSRLSLKKEAITTGDTLSNMNKKDITEFEKIVRGKIVEAVNPSDWSCLENANLPHRIFARWVTGSERTHPIQIFSLNYDTVIERAFEKERVPIFDGFVGGFNPFFFEESVRLDSTKNSIEKNWTRLWKLHGSVNWEREEGGMIIKNNSKESGYMIYPSFEKYNFSRQRPYLTLVDQLRNFLMQDDSVLIILGYSFGDEHINDLIFNTIKNKPRTQIFALQYDEFKSTNHKLIERTKSMKNVTCIFPDKYIKASKEKEASNQNEEDGIAEYNNLGDFNDFVSILNKINHDYSYINSSDKNEEKK